MNFFLNCCFFNCFCSLLPSLDEIDGRLNDLEKNLDSSIKAADGIQGAEANHNASNSKPKNNLNQNWDLQDI